VGEGGGAQQFEVSRIGRQPDQAAEQEAVVGDEERSADSPGDARHEGSEGDPDVVGEDECREPGQAHRPHALIGGVRLGHPEELRRHQPRHDLGRGQRPHAHRHSRQHHDQGCQSDHAASRPQQRPVPVREEVDQVPSPGRSFVDHSLRPSDEHFEPVYHGTRRESTAGRDQVGRCGTVETGQPQDLVTIQSLGSTTGGIEEIGQFLPAPAAVFFELLDTDLAIHPPPA